MFDEVVIMCIFTDGTLPKQTTGMVLQVNDVGGQICHVGIFSSETHKIARERSRNALIPMTGTQTIISRKATMAREHTKYH